MKLTKFPFVSKHLSVLCHVDLCNIKLNAHYKLTGKIDECYFICNVNVCQVLMYHKKLKKNF